LVSTPIWIDSRRLQMKHSDRIIRMVLLSLVLVCFSGDWATADERTIEEIRFERVSAAEERISFTLGGYAPPMVFGIEGDPGRLVCDFFDTEIKPHIPRTQTTEGNLILSIRIGRHTAPRQKIRVVCDLAPAYDRDYIVEQHYHENNIFVLTVRLQ